MNKIQKICLYTIMASTICSSSYAFEGTINKIIIDGNKRIEKETILSYLNLKVGDSISSATQDQAIKNLYATSLFEDLKIDFNKGVLQIAVKEYPLITKVEFKGNSKINSATLKKETLTKIGASVSKSIIGADIVKIKELYKRQAKYLVNIDVKVQPLKNNRARVIFNVSEGPKTEVKNIYFVGNRNYKDGELRSIILTKEKIWIKFWENNAYDPEKIEHDKYKLKSFYNSLGYADFQIISVNPQLSANKDFFNITYVIEEGEQYFLGKLEIENEIKGINVDELKKFIKVKVGNIYNNDTLDEISSSMSEYLENKGYAEIKVNAEIKHKNPDSRIVDIAFVVAKTDKVYINKINILGNVKTHDKVIRREFKISENDIFNRDDIDRGYRNLVNLDYFETIAIQPASTENPDKKDLKITIQEKSTANVALEGGFSSFEGPFVRVAYNERNFLGTGKSFRTDVTKGRNKISSSIGIIEPHFLDRNLTLGGSIFMSNTGQTKGKFGSVDQPYKNQSYGAKIHLGYDITTDLEHQIYYLYKYDHIKAAGENSSLYIKEQQGKYQTSAVGHTLSYDKTDNRIFPKNGYIVSGSQEYAGLGGDIKFLKNEVDFNAYKSFYNNNLTFKLLTSAGNIFGTNGKKVMIRDRFNMGDPIFRGFAAGGMGPRLKSKNDSIGGQKFYKITTELSFPLGLPKELNVIGNIFADYGAIWSYDLQKNSTLTRDDFYDSKKPNLSVGLGVLWITNIAPIRVDWAIPVRKKKYDETQRWHFRFTASF